MGGKYGRKNVVTSIGDREVVLVGGTGGYREVVVEGKVVAAGGAQEVVEG